jgi:hypothetical protein
MASAPKPKKQVETLENTHRVNDHINGTTGFDFDGFPYYRLPEFRLSLALRKPVRLISLDNDWQMDFPGWEYQASAYSPSVV